MAPNTLAARAAGTPKMPLTLKDALLSLVDFRIDRRKKCPLHEILMVAVCAMIDGAKGPTDFERFGKAKAGLPGKFLRLENGIPSHGTARFARSASAASSQRPAASRRGRLPSLRHWPLAAGC